MANSAWLLVSVIAAEHEFAQRLGILEGQDFQDEVCRFLRRCVNDFQHITAKPQGDGGLDGLSHAQSVAYCCYGPEQEPSKVKARGLEKDIVEKFRGDLRRIFELHPKGKGKKAVLLHAPNEEIGTILASGRKITLVRLIVSVLDTHRIVGPLNDAFEACRQSSQCTYVDKNASFTIWGPKELATTGAVDDATILRIDQRVLLRRVNVVLANPPANRSPLVTSDFDAKFDWIETNGKPRPGTVTKLRTYFMRRWSRYWQLKTTSRTTRSHFTRDYQVPEKRRLSMRSSRRAHRRPHLYCSSRCERSSSSGSSNILVQNSQPTSCVDSPTAKLLASLANAPSIGGADHALIFAL